LAADDMEARAKRSQAREHPPHAGSFEDRDAPDDRADREQHRDQGSRRRSRSHCVHRERCDQACSDKASAESQRVPLIGRRQRGGADRDGDERYGRPRERGVPEQGMRAEQHQSGHRQGHEYGQLEGRELEPASREPGQRNFKRRDRRHGENTGGERSRRRARKIPWRRNDIASEGWHDESRMVQDAFLRSTPVRLVHCWPECVVREV